MHGCTVLQSRKRFGIAPCAVLIAALNLAGCTTYSPSVETATASPLNALGPAAAGLAPALHVIGVHEGQPRPGSDNRPWWAKCKENPETANSQMACHMRYASERTEKDVRVNISDSSRPIVLALSAYDMTLWTVNLQPGVVLKKVILSGYHSQRIVGTPPDMRVETYTYDPSPCDRCWQGDKNFYSHSAVPLELKAITGLDAASFQGRYVGTEFSIFPGISIR